MKRTLTSTSSKDSLSAPLESPQKVSKFARLVKVISGGQTGADRAGLEAAKILGIVTGGVAPKGWKTENGSDESLKEYGLQEGSNGYPQRTKKNVDIADATIVFRLHSGVGTDKTIGYAQTHTWCSRKESNDKGYRPVLVVTSLEDTNANKIVEFLQRNNVKVVNIAGHRESTSGVPNFSSRVRDILVTAFAAYNEIL